MKKYIFMVIMLSNLACQSTDKKTNVGVEVLSKKHSSPLSVNRPIKSLISSDTLKLYNDDFLLNSLKYNFTISNIASIYPGITPSEQIIPNPIEPNQIDTLVKFINANDQIVFHKGGGNVVLETASIQSAVMTIDNSVYIGMTKNNFMQKFNLTTMPDICSVQDIEGGNIFVFLFANGMLSKISFRVIYY